MAVGEAPSRGDADRVLAGEAGWRATQVGLCCRQLGKAGHTQHTATNGPVCRQPPPTDASFLALCPKAIEDVDAVVSSIGGSVADPSADSIGNINIIEAAAKKGVKKFVLVCGRARLRLGPLCTEWAGHQ